LRRKTKKYFQLPIFPHAQELVRELVSQGSVKTGKPVFTWSNPRKALESACARLGLPRFSLRALRRAFIIHCLEQGLEPRVVAEWQGHKDAKLILDTYGKYVSREHAKAQAAKSDSSGAST
jgi:integrase